MRTFDLAHDDYHWKQLFEIHVQSLQSLNAISTLWISGFSKLGLDQSKRPHAEQLTLALKPYTGYTFIQTHENVILDQKSWYTMISNYQMPLTHFVRRPDELDYCDEPDIWHDIMGHIPFLAEKSYSDMYQLLAKTYLRALDAERSDLLIELDFIGGMLIELGLIREPTGIKAFGATFYSSSEVKIAFDPKNQIPFTVNELTNGASYDRHSFQGKYYIFDSLAQLVQLIEQISNRI
jgi:phenylalanine-4-hydroxylase